MVPGLEKALTMCQLSFFRSVVLGIGPALGRVLEMCVCVPSVVEESCLSVCPLKYMLFY